MKKLKKPNPTRRHKIEFENGSKIILEPVGVREKLKSFITFEQAQEIFFGKKHV